MTAKLNSRTGVIVTVTEQFKGSNGTEWIRGKSKEGHRIIAPARLFTMIQDQDHKAIIDPVCLQPQMVASIEELKSKWSK
jgi:hypothetical protein